jgi:hypothetical protein
MRNSYDETDLHVAFTIAVFAAHLLLCFRNKGTAASRSDAARAATNARLAAYCATIVGIIIASIVVVVVVDSHARTAATAIRVDVDVVDVACGTVCDARRAETNSSAAAIDFGACVVRVMRCAILIH